MGRPCTGQRLSSAAGAGAGSGRRPRSLGVAKKDGFSLVEVMFALMILVLAMATMALILTRAFAAVATGNFSQQATELADSVIAQDEALPWSTLQEGLSSQDPTFSSDSSNGNITSGSSGYCFEGMDLVVDGNPGTCSAWTGTWVNPSVGTTCASSIAPDAASPVYQSGSTSYLTHEQCVQLNGQGQTFEISVYPTGNSTSAWPDQLEITVVVSWGSAGTSGGAPTHLTDSAILSCGATGGLPQHPGC
jgi:prepilin-type N-terminal cleavage/methylation domain-containing protein